MRGTALVGGGLGKGGGALHYAIFFAQDVFHCVRDGQVDISDQFSKNPFVEFGNKDDWCTLTQLLR